MIWAAALLLALAAVVVMRTLLCKSRQTRVAAVEPIAVDDGAAERLAKALACRTLAYHDRLETAEFEKLHALLRTSFPHVHRELRREVVGEFGLLYTWKGRDPSRRPLLLMAHQDVVPVEDGATGPMRPLPGRSPTALSGDGGVLMTKARSWASWRVSSGCSSTTTDQRAPCTWLLAPTRR